METGDDVLTVWRAVADTYPMELELAQKAGLLSSGSHKQPLPPAQNAAMFYREIVALGNRQTAPDTSPETLETLLDFLDFNTLAPAEIHRVQQAAQASPGLQLAHLAAALPHCDFERSPGEPSPELAALRQAARLLRAESLLLANQGKAEEAVRNQALVFRVVRHAAAGNMLINWLVALAVDAIALAGIARILTLCGDDAAIAGIIAQTLEQEWQPLALAPVMARETGWLQDELTRARQEGFFPYLLRNMDEMFVELPAEMEEDKEEYERSRQEARAELERTLQPETSHALADRANEALLLDAVAAFLLHWMRQLHAAADQPYPQANPVFTVFRHELETPPALPDGPRAIRLIPNHLVFTLAAPIEHKAYETARGLTLLAAARLLAQRDTLPDGAFPDTLSNLPLDPFTSNPLHYRKEDTGFVIYSVGPDGNFDGGKPGISLRGQVGGLLFRYSPGVPD